MTTSVPAEIVCTTQLAYKKRVTEMSGCEYAFLDANTPADHVDLIKEAFDQDPESLYYFNYKNVLYSLIVLLYDLL